GDSRTPGLGIFAHETLEVFEREVELAYADLEVHGCPEFHGVFRLLKEGAIFILGFFQLLLLGVAFLGGLGFFLPQRVRNNQSQEGRAQQPSPNVLQHEMCLQKIPNLENREVPLCSDENRSDYSPRSPCSISISGRIKSS